VGNLERYMQMCKDLKKDIDYHKSSGTWSWYDRWDKADNPLSYTSYGPFDTFLETLCDIVDPYIEQE